eukprot:TRINITY_DN60522_c0_g1_i1.p1 TRINITY_DN60522_c0_g1~~TRINITY_DN60522_c0_g1_i1.p1  ORF type:complete len:606 (+),score=100.98 TRINITY_DN60522_c0_g1_i1:75-1892(+)
MMAQPDGLLNLSLLSVSSDVYGCDIWVTHTVRVVGAMRGWSKQDQRNALEKLSTIGATTLPELRRKLRNLNDSLREAGCRTFHRRTVVCLHNVVALLQVRAALHGAAGSPRGSLGEALGCSLSGLSMSLYQSTVGGGSDDSGAFSADAFLPGHVCGFLFSFLPQQGLRKVLCCCQSWRNAVQRAFSTELYGFGGNHQHKLSVSHGHSAVVIRGSAYAMGAGELSGASASAADGGPWSHEPCRVGGLRGYTALSVCCGDGFGAVLTDDGILFAYARDPKDEGKPINARLVSAALSAGLPLDERICTMRGSGGKRVVLVTVSGRMCIVGKDWFAAATRSPATVLAATSLPPIEWIPLPAGAGRIASVACSSVHCVAADENGVCYTVGNNSFGQLGHGDWEDRDTLTPVSALKELGEEVVGVTCASFFTLAVTSSGRLYSWGGQRKEAAPTSAPEDLEDFSAAALGFDSGGDSCGSLTPRQVLGELEGRRVVAASAGSSHSAVITDDGRLFTFGLGELGHGPGHADDDYFQQVSEPREVQPFCDVVAVACSADATMLLCRDGHVRTFGLDQSGMLGHSMKVHPCPSFPGHARIVHPLVVDALPLAPVN